MLNLPTHEVEYEVWLGDECVAITCGPGAYADARNYARAYAQDGDVRIFYIAKRRELTEVLHMGEML